MILCPIALAVGCRKCAVFSVCPLKTVIGDQPEVAEAPPEPPTPERSSKPNKSKAKKR